MCGFAGAVTSRLTSEAWESSLRAMADSLTHRGPDDAGVWHDAKAGVGFAHRRLAIVDLSPRGKQPMTTQCQRYTLVLNGEIYNFRELRTELLDRGHTFRGDSDTEVLLCAITEWGVEAGIQRCVGMFAFAVWDRKNQHVVLGRDRMGEKPLYYGWQGDCFVFASELRAMRVHPSWQGEIDRNSLTLLLRHNYIPAPYSIYRNIKKLRPGTLIKVPVSAPHGTWPETTTYWSTRRAVERGQRSTFRGTDEDAVDQLEQLLKLSIAGQMISDVPIGAFLSGGVDSSAIVALMQKMSSQPVRTFTIGFEDDAFDESAYADAVAKHLGTNHTCLRVGSEQALSVVPKLPSIYDEPFSDSSQIPTFLVSQLAKQSVTVCLSGDAGDELFGGYPRYQHALRLGNILNAIPSYLCRLARIGINALPTSAWERGLGLAGPLLPAAARNRRLGDKMHNLAELLNDLSREELYRQVVSHWGAPTRTIPHSHEPSTVLTDPAQWPQQSAPIERMMFLDMMSYLPDDILTKVDRAAMAVSLETRIPLLDHRIVEFAWRLPLKLKVREAGSKWILRQVLYRHVPRELIERPKVGFGVPLASWLRGPLKDWAESQISISRLKSEGFFDVKIVRDKWNVHQQGNGNWHAWLWNILMFQAWYEEWHRSS